ncbi:Cell division protein FtsZ 2-1, chloroplastic [Glycine soja]
MISEKGCYGVTNPCGPPSWSYVYCSGGRVTQIQTKNLGKSRARDVALNAIQSPLLDIGIERATGIVWDITGGTDLTLFEVSFVMDKSWISKARNSIDYSIGLSKFLDFAFKNGAIGEMIWCPCPKCGFMKWQTRDIVEDHLLYKPFPQNYVIWDLHGEKQALESSQVEDVFQDSGVQPQNPMEMMINDAFEQYRQHDPNPRFYFKINEAGAKRCCKLSMRRKWAANRQSLWNEFNDPTKTRDEIIKNVPIGIDKDQWARFVHYRHKPSTLELCRRNKEIRRKQVIPHTGGSKANPRRRNELVMTLNLLETGKLPSRGQLYIETHKRKDGSFVNEAAKTIAEQIEVGLTQSIVDESEVSPLDAVGRVLGNTRLRASSLSSSSSGVGFPSSNQWQEKYNNLESAFKAYMIMKEGRIPEELASYFTLDQTHLNDASSVPNTPLDARGSSGASNP